MRGPKPSRSGWDFWPPAWDICPCPKADEEPSDPPDWRAASREPLPRAGRAERLDTRGALPGRPESRSSGDGAMSGRRPQRQADSRPASISAPRPKESQTADGASRRALADTTCPASRAQRLRLPQHAGRRGGREIRTSLGCIPGAPGIRSQSSTRGDSPGRPVRGYAYTTTRLPLTAAREISRPSVAGSDTSGTRELRR